MNDRSQIFFKIGVFKNFTIFTEKRLCWNLFLIKLCQVADLKACNLIKKRLQHRCFPLNIDKFLKTAFLQNTSDGCFLFNRDLLREFGIPISSFSPSAHEIHFQKEFFEGNLPFIPPNIIMSWVRSVSTSTCNWQKLDQDNN